MRESKSKQFLTSADATAIKILQWPGQRLIALLLFLGDKKRLFPNGFKKTLVYLLIPIVSGLVTYWGLKDQAEPGYWPNILGNLGITYAVTRSFLVSTVCAFLAFIICRALLPLMFYAPHAMSMRSMGLLEASVRKGGMQSAIVKFLRWHDSDKPVKVICISGHYLFGSQGPLFQLAEKGQLEVLFPQSDKSNPTIKARYATYNANFRADTYPTLGDLVREIEISKNVLRKNAGNKISEHAELCMWRVVLLSDHCIVQNYFPNHSGRHSDSAPVFVFYREPECPHSYYDTFYQMFELLSSPK
jgi:hypothetical protein